MSVFKIVCLFALVQLLTIFAVASPQAVLAQTYGRLDISGRVGGRMSGGTASFSVQKLANWGAPGTYSGTIELALWATRSGYQGQAYLTGYKMLLCKYRGLNGGYYYSNLSCSGRQRRRVPHGRYVMTLTASEFGGSYYIQDWVNFSRKAIL